jgi:hypothetical protein
MFGDAGCGYPYMNSYFTLPEKELLIILFYSTNPSAFCETAAVPNKFDFEKGNPEN